MAIDLDSIYQPGLTSEEIELVKQLKGPLPRQWLLKLRLREVDKFKWLLVEYIPEAKGWKMLAGLDSIPLDYRVLLVVVLARLMQHLKSIKGL